MSKVLRGYSPGMRWDHLFDDLEAQFAQRERQEVLAQVPDRTRHERAQVSWFDRVAAGVGTKIVLSTVAGPVEGELTDLGRDWVVVEEPGRSSAIVPATAIVSIGGLGRRSDQAPSVTRRFGLGVALRGISRDRSAVAVHDTAGSVWVGTIDFVGSDHVEVVLHPADAVRRGGAVTGRRVLPWPAIAVIRRIG